MNRVQLIRNGDLFINSLTNTEDHKVSEYQITCGNDIFVLTRNQVEQFYRYYTKRGYNLTIADLVNYFPTFTFKDLSNIRQAFYNSHCLRKEDNIITPHEYEENTVDEIQDIISEFIKRKQVLSCQSKLPSTLNKIIEEQKEEIAKLKDYRTIIKEGFKDVPLTIKEINVTPCKRSIAIWLSDMHIGCAVTPYGAVMNENIGWNNTMVLSRLDMLLTTIKQHGKFNEIWVFNLGDAIDGMDRTTSRRDVSLPQNMSNSEMARCYRLDINYLFDTMIENDMANKYYFRSVSQSNHGGDFEAQVNEFLVNQLSKKGIDSFMPDTTFGITKIQEIPIVYGHGKDTLHQNRPLGVYLDTRTKAYIDSLLRANGLTQHFGNILVVKGDSHQYNLSGCNDYTYLSVGSLFGSSEWAQSNFPNRGWEINYSIIEDFSIIHGSIKDVNCKIKNANFT